MKEAMEMVKEELGIDAVILHTKKYRKGGFLGYKSKEIVEVTAAVEDQPMPAPYESEKAGQRPSGDANEKKPEEKAAPPLLPKQILNRYKSSGTTPPVLPPMPDPEDIPAPMPEPQWEEPQQEQEQKEVPSEPKEPISDDKSDKEDKEVKAEQEIIPSEEQQEDEQEDIEVMEEPEEVQEEMEEEPELPSDENGMELPESEVAESQEEMPEDPEIMEDEEENEPDAVQTVMPPQKKKTAVRKRPNSGNEQASEAASKTKRAKKIKAVRENPVKEEAEEQEEAAAMKELRSARPLPEDSFADNSLAEKAEKDAKIRRLEDELGEMKMLLAQVMRQSQNASTDVVTLQEALHKQEINDRILEDMIRRMPPEVISSDKKSSEAAKALRGYIYRTFRLTEGISVRKGEHPKIAALIGATGVGKTTTLAKIAARFVLEDGLSVALITADTYRISAVEQLKTYSDIIGLPLEIVYSSKELFAAIRKHHDKQLVLIDTAGRSQHNEDQMQELRDLLSVDSRIERHLVLSATTKQADAEEIVERFSICNPDCLIFTKTDETRSLGLILNILGKYRSPLSYFTTGQSVPDDIVPARSEKLAELLLR